MVEVDARGLACPEPMMLVHDALKANKGPVKVMVSEPHQKTNIEKLAKKLKRTATSVEDGSGFVITIE